jgi:hypothetical protein
MVDQMMNTLLNSSLLLQIMHSAKNPVIFEHFRNNFVLDEELRDPRRHP